MRFRFVLRLAFLCLVFVLTTLMVMAQETSSEDAISEQVTSAEDTSDATSDSVRSNPSQETPHLHGEEPKPYELPPTQAVEEAWRQISVVPAFTIEVASDSCESAATLPLPGGDVTQLSEDFGQSISDPILGCAWGSPTSSRGFRTVWYKFDAPANGRVRINTLRSNYDTILSVYSSADEDSPCQSLVQLACDDDTNGFASEIVMDVQRGVTYYIEVADWHQSPPPQPAVWLSLVVEDLPSRWQQDGVMPVGRSRHVGVVVDQDIYVLGGQTELSDDNVEVLRSMERFETDTGNWVSLADMPTDGVNGNGYSHTTAVYINHPVEGPSIYVPFGDNGFNYVGRHWVYRIDGGLGYWEEKASLGAGLSPNWPDGVPFTWSAAVADPNDPTGYYLLGGLSSQNTLSGDVLAHDKVYYYSIQQDVWTNTIPDMVAYPDGAATEAPRYGHMAVWLNGEMCFIGGLSAGEDNPSIQSSGGCYNFGAQEWRSIASLNRPRFGAGSAVGPDGRWYIYGGFGTDSTNVLTALSEVEVYDPGSNTWATLSISYDLGGRITVVDGGLVTVPARGWVRGGFVGDELWAIGGDIPGVNEPLSLIEKLTNPPYNAYLPYFEKFTDDRYDNFSEADPLQLNVTEFHNFDNTLDLYDIYYFDLPTRRTVTVEVRDIESGFDFELSIYDANKLLWGSSNRPGGLHEFVTLNSLAPGRYYVVVNRLLPVSDPDPSIYYRVHVLD